MLPGEYQIDPLLVPSPLPSRTSPPGQAQSIGSVVGPTTPNQRSLIPPPSWEERPPEGTAPLFSQEQLSQLRRLQQASPLLKGAPQAQEEQTGSSNTTIIQEEVRRQVSDFMSQQAQAMHRLQSEKEALRERLQVRQSPPHERPQLVDQPPQPTFRVAMPRPLGVPTSFHPGSVAAQEPQSSNAPQVVEQAPQGQGLGGFERLMQQVSGPHQPEGRDLS